MLAKAKSKFLGSMKTWSNAMEKSSFSLSELPQKNKDKVVKTWEKWYWGIVLSLFTLVVVAIVLSTEGVKIIKTINNRTTITYISRGKALAYFIPIYLGVFGLIWLIAKAATSGFSKK